MSGLRGYGRDLTFYPDGTPMPEGIDGLIREWGRINDPAKPWQWVVAQDHVGAYWLSTVWIGQSVGTFETALFKDGELVDVLFRYESWLDGLRAHLVLLTALQLRYALPRWPAPQDLYDVAQQVTDDILGPGTWRDPRRLYGSMRECAECGTPVLVKWTEEAGAYPAPRSCAEHS